MIRTSFVYGLKYSREKNCTFAIARSKRNSSATSDQLVCVFEFVEKQNDQSLYLYQKKNRDCVNNFCFPLPFFLNQSYLPFCPFPFLPPCVIAFLRFCISALYIHTLLHTQSVSQGCEIGSSLKFELTSFYFCFFGISLKWDRCLNF